MAQGRKTGGRQRGTLNRATREGKALAQQYTELAIAALAAVLTDTKAPLIARVKAAEVLLDRGHGRPTQHVESRISPLEELTDDELTAGIAALRAGLIH